MCEKVKKMLLTCVVQVIEASQAGAKPNPDPMEEEASNTETDMEKHTFAFDPLMVRLLTQNSASRPDPSLHLQGEPLAECGRRGLPKHRQAPRHRPPDEGFCLHLRRPLPRPRPSTIPRLSQATCANPASEPPSPASKAGFLTSHSPSWSRRPCCIRSRCVRRC